MAGRRPERLREQIRDEVSLIVQGELKDPRISSAAVTDVELSADLRHARVYINVLGDVQDVRGTLAALKSASGFVRWQLGQSLRLRVTPQLHFALDKTARAATRIEQILKEEGSKEQRQDRTGETPGSSFSSSAEADPEVISG
jgi:ribosome-binding factor A